MITREREKFESKCKPGLWVGRNLESNGHVVVPLEGWDPVEMTQMLGKPITVSTVTVFESEFPLRVIPLGRNQGLKEFCDWVDRIDPRYQHAPKQGDSPLTKVIEESAEREYLIKAIIGRAHRGRARRYYIEWDESEGGGVTVEPESELDPELVREYELKIQQAEQALAANVMTVNNMMSDMEKMIAELIVKQKQTGTVSDWKEGVEDEFNTVRSLRFAEVDLETQERVLREGTAMKLRMILELKKDSRRKGRLVGQGFWEDVGLTGMHVDSPVASFATVRTILFQAGRVGEVIASGDITKAFMMADEYPADAEPRYVRFSMYKGGPEYVWRLKGPLYGSRDSPKLWYESFRKFMKTAEAIGGMGFKMNTEVHGQSDIDQVLSGVGDSFIQGGNEPCVFRHPVTGLLVVLFVDDIITRGMPEVTEEFYARLNSKYALRSWGILSVNNPLKHLGFTITEQLVNGELHRYMDQADDVRRFISDQGLELIRPVNSPMPDKNGMLKHPELLDEEDRKWFTSLVGSMSWFAISLGGILPILYLDFSKWGINPLGGD